MRNPLVALFLFALNASAAVEPPRQLLVDLKVYTGGKLISRPRVVLNTGKKSEISDVNSKTGKGQFVEVTAYANPDSPEQAFLQMVIGKIENGKKTVIGTPQLSALMKEEAAMEIEENGKQVFKVVATVSPREAPAPKAPLKKK